jgi:adenosylmethionine-8-amino-7-oxononanoate aminotransferase
MLWFPYKQMKLVNELPKLAQAKGVTLEFEDGSTCIDGISSWWAKIHGYNHPELNRALREQSERFSHIMLGGITHDPAINLAATLVNITPQGLDHVFFSDSGSVGVEVALKMAIQYWKNIGKEGKYRFVSLVNGYHGDTFKAMEVSDDSDFSAAFSGVLQRGFTVAIPKGGYTATDAEIAVALQELEIVLADHHHQIAAFIVEPIVQCAGGFQIYSPKYLELAKALCEQYEVLLIFDEVATGFGRTGTLFASNQVGITPDIMVLGKALTAGYMGHAATLTTATVFMSFWGDSYDKAFMHGPTFMGNALACAVANASIAIFQRENYLDKIKAIEAQLLQGFQAIDSEVITDRRIIGAIGALELKDASYLQGFADYAIEHGAWLRPIGNVVYIMPPYIISSSELGHLISVITKWVEQW